MLSELRQKIPKTYAVAVPRGTIRLHAMTTSAGCERVENKHYDWNGLRRGPAEFVLIQHTISGRGHMRFEDDRHILGPGDTMLLRFPHRNRYWLQQGDVWEFFWLCLNGREVLRIFRQMMAGSGPVVRLPEVAVNRLAGLCTTVVDGEAATPARASAIAYEAVMTLADEVMSPRPQNDSATRPASIQAAIDFVRGRLDQPLSIVQMAEAAGYSRHHFSRIFSESEGMSPAEFLERERMTRAVRMLQAGSTSIKTVARTCGYDDPGYFAKVFRRAFGRSPTEFRDSAARRAAIEDR